MKKIVFHILRVFVALFQLPPAYAADDEIINKVGKVGKTIGYSPINANAQEAQGRVGDLVGIIVESFLAALGIVFLVLIFWAGWLWMSAAGEEDKVRKAQSIIKTSVIGLFVVSMAYAITRLVSTLIGGAGLFQ